ncbi:ribosomal protein L22/L17 [Phyllosticta capitalensis]|uniref:Ribosomal protein L22/L17 n=2 Tax=Phyllosticta capitalensis TaxID=121624 RepID=A0ABR1YZI6_9PEZI
MSVRLPARRLLQPVVSLPIQPQRAFSFRNLFRSKKKDTEGQINQGSANPILDDYLAKKRAQQPQQGGGPGPKGDLAPTSIFDDGKKKPTEAKSREEQRRAAKKERNRQAMAMALDPKPDQRMRWERKMVIREVRKRGRLTRAQQIKQTEREDLVKSPWIKTSVKKLNLLARQIAGKPLDEAMLQMRFSKKKPAQDILQHLEYARDHAIVSRGMGLGKAEGTAGSPTEIRLKNGKRKLVEDKTSLYVDQAWVGRGEYGRAYDYRARGRVNIMRLPKTSISVVLKEEATRIRQHKEREEKKANRKVWVHLPDRVIPTQRQHVMW